MRQWYLCVVWWNFSTKEFALIINENLTSKFLSFSVQQQNWFLCIIQHRMWSGKHSNCTEKHDEYFKVFLGHSCKCRVHEVLWCLFIDAAGCNWLHLLFGEGRPSQLNPAPRHHGGSVGWRNGPTAVWLYVWSSGRKWCIYAEDKHENMTLAHFIFSLF